MVTRQDQQFLYLIAVRRGANTSNVSFSGLPANATTAEALFEYVQQPPPPPIQPGKQTFRSISVGNGVFRDWFGPHDARVYRLAH